MKYEVVLNGKTIPIDIQAQGDQLIIDSELGKLNYEAVKIQSGVYSVILEGKSFVVGVSSKDEQRVSVNGAPLTIKLLDAIHIHLRELGWESAKESKMGLVESQIPGLITKVFHQIGDQVEEGEPLFLMEAMKMENEIKSPISGTILKISAKEGETVDKGTKIIEIG